MKRITNLFILWATMQFMVTQVSGNTYQITSTNNFFSTLNLSAYDTVLVKYNCTVTDLIIGAGTKIIFEGNYSININSAGSVIAIGTQAQPIIFKPTNVITGWNGIRFSSGSYSNRSEFKYCEFYNGVSTNYGAALQAYYNYDLLIDHCKFVNNYSTANGGAIYLQYSVVTISNCMFTQNNTYSYGSCIYNYWGDVNIIQNLFVNNDGFEQICSHGGSYTTKLYNNTIANNKGNAISCSGNSLIAKNNILYGNDNNFNLSGISLVLQNNLINPISAEINGTNAYSCDGSRNISGNPGFISPSSVVGGSVNGLLNDWSITSSSVCNNHGYYDTVSMMLPTVDLAGNMRVKTNIIDIGAYESQSSSGINLLFDCDFNNNARNVGTSGIEVAFEDPTLGYLASRFSYKNAAVFTGSNLVSFDSIARSFGSGGSFSVSLWVYPDVIASGQNYVLLSEKTGTNGSWELSIEDQKLAISIWKSGTESHFVSSDLKVMANAWQNITVVSNGSVIEMYKNGKFVSGFAYSSGMDWAGQKLNVGANYLLANGFIGRISDLNIFDGALSTADISGLYNQKGPRLETFLNTKSISFQVNMNKLIQTGSFNPGTENVYILSDLNGWAFNRQLVINTYNDLYEVQIDSIPSGEFFNFKFGISAVKQETATRSIAINDTVTGFSACYNDDCIAVDIKALGITNLNDDCCFSASEYVNIEFSNVGGADYLGNIYFAFQVDNGPWVLDTLYTYSLFRLESSSAEFPIDLSALGTHIVKAVVSGTSDGFHGNDTVTKTVVNTPLFDTFPYLDNFESSNNWTAIGDSGSCWIKGTPAKTHLSGAYSGVNAWITNLSGLSNDNEDSYLLSPYFSLPDSTMAISFKFWRNMASNSFAYIEYSENGSGYWYELSPNYVNNNYFNNPNYYYSSTVINEGGPTKSSNGFSVSYNGYTWSGRTDGWVTYTYYLSQSNTNIRFRIRYVNDGISSSEGFAIDDFRVFYQPAIDIKITDIYPYSSPWISYSDTLNVKLFNYGNQAASSGIINVSGDINTNGSYYELYSFDQGVFKMGYPSGIGDIGRKYNMLFKVTDGTLYDSLNHSIRVQKSYSTLPYFEDFENIASIDSNWFTHNYIFGKDADLGVSHPSGNKLNAAYSGNYALTSADGEQLPFTSTTFFESPGFNLASVASPVVLSFYMKRNITDQDNKFGIQIKDTNGIWDQVSVLGGENWAEDHAENSIGYFDYWNSVVDSKWVFVRVTLSPLYSGQSQIQFRFVLDLFENFTFDEGVVIDNFKLEEAPEVDLKPIALISPVSGSSIGSENVTINIAQYGSATTCPYLIASYSVNNAPFVIDTVYNPVLDVNNVLPLTFPVNYTFADNGTFNFTIAVTGQNEGYNSNDTSHFIIYKQPVRSVPYKEDFEGESFWVSPDNNIWKQGTPTGNHINSAYSGTKALYTDLQGASNNESVVYESSYYNFTDTYTGVSMKLNKDFMASKQALVLEYYSEYDEFWQIWGITSQHWYDGYYSDLGVGYGWGGQGGWLDEYSYNYFTSPGSLGLVKFRLRYISNSNNAPNYNGCAVDDFVVYNASNDYGLISIKPDTSQAASANILINIRNQGSGTKTSKSLKYVIDGVEYSTTVNTSGVYPGSTSVFRSTEAFNLSAPGVHTLQAYFNEAVDGNPFNDTVKNDINVPEPIDLVITQIKMPYLNAIQSSDTVRIVVYNNATAVIDSATFSVIVDDVPIFDEDITGLNLIAGETRTITLSQTLNLNQANKYRIKVVGTIQNDISQLDNTMENTLVKVPGITIVSGTGYADGFETLQNWVPDGNPGWAMGTPAGSVINHANGGAKAWVTNLSGNISTAVSELYMPIFSFPQNCTPVVSFDKWSQTNAKNGAALMYSIDNAETWKLAVNGINWYNDSLMSMLDNYYGTTKGWSGFDTDWVSVSVGIPELAGKQNVAFRIVFAKDSVPTEGFAVDNFKVSLDSLPVASFTYSITNYDVTFTNTSTGSNLSLIYDFGDGQTSTDVNPVNTYIPGSYNACLDITDAWGNVDTYCDSIKIEPIVCTADYSYLQGSDTLYFTSLASANINKFEWDFGDGNASNIASPFHVFAATGTYTVKFVVTDTVFGCSDTVSYDIFVQLPILLNPSFTYSVNNNEVIFTSTSTGNITGYYWSFGDGGSSEEISPVYTYLVPGDYTVCLTISDTISAGSADTCQSVTLDFSNCGINFSWTSDSLLVSFTASPVANPTGYLWNFGDGNFSDEIAPVHQFGSANYYEVTLSIEDTANNCMNSITKMVPVLPNGEELVYASFTYSIDSNQVTFQNTSQGNHNNVLWSFGDGFYSTEYNPVHEYLNSDYYQVSLAVFDSISGNLDQYTEDINVEFGGQINCNVTIQSFTQGNIVSFEAVSSMDTAVYMWEFGDGTYGYEAVMDHFYSDGGYYFATLYAYNPLTQCVAQASKNIYINDTTGNACNAEFSSYTNKYKVSFTNQSIGNYQVCFWDFGDGTNSNHLNPVHDYTKAGYYDVMLTIGDTALGIFSSKTNKVYVAGELTAQPVQANFMFYPSQDSLYVKFQDKSMGIITNWYWDFGDNTETSLLKNPGHIYVYNDYFKVCLTASNPGYINSQCKFVPVGDVTGKNTAYFTYYADSVTSTAYFKNESLGDIASYVWEFGDGNTSSQKNPAHAYADTGYYAVCLTTISTTGNVRTYCNDIRIGDALANPCIFSCVWPGDANNDLEANHYDLLTIGLNYNMVGPYREDASLKWYGQYARNWSTYQLDETNNKYGDCNGDGIINADDTLAIVRNFAFSHYRQPDFKSVDWIVSCQWDKDTKGVGSRKGAKAILSPPSKSKPGSIYGIGYEIEVLNPGAVYWDSVGVKFNDSWIGTEGDDMLAFYSVDAAKATIYISVVRTDHSDITGEGETAEIFFTFNPELTSKDISFNVTTMGGINSDGITVGAAGEILLNLGDDKQACQGNIVTLSAPDGFASYKWSSGDETQSIDVTQPGTYILTVTNDAGAADQDTIDIVFNALPLIDLGLDINADTAVILDAGEGFESYLWSTEETTQTINVETTGEYWVMVSNAYGCSNADTINITISGISNNLAAYPVTVYPNPNQGSFWLNIDKDLYAKVDCEIFDTKGQMIFKQSINVEGKLHQMIEPDNLAKGLYYLKINIDGDTRIVKMVVH